MGFNTLREKVETRDKFRLWYLLGLKYSKDPKRWFLRYLGRNEMNASHFISISGLGVGWSVWVSYLFYQEESVIWAQCPWSQITERSSQWWKSVLSSENSLDSGKSLVTLPWKKSTCLWSQSKRVFSRKFTFHSWCTILFYEWRDLHLTADLDGTGFCFYMLL